MNGPIINNKLYKKENELLSWLSKKKLNQPTKLYCTYLFQIKQHIDKIKIKH